MDPSVRIRHTFVPSAIAVADGAALLVKQVKRRSTPLQPCTLSTSSLTALVPFASILTKYQKGKHTTDESAIYACHLVDELVDGVGPLGHRREVRDQQRVVVHLAMRG
jgi:hypothetical protein